MDLIQFKRFFNEQPRYRFGQAKRAIFQDLIQSWQEAVTLPLNLREELKNAANKALEHGIKIGGDIVETIKKDINEINKSNKNKKNKI